MNDAIRKRTAAVLSIKEDAVSDEDVVKALDTLQERDNKHGMNETLTDAKAKLQAHVDRGAVSTAAFDAAIADIEKGKTPEARKGLTSKWNDSWSVLDGDRIPTDPKGKGGEGPGAEEQASVSASIGDRVAKLMSEKKNLTPLEAHQEVMSSLTDKERAAYEKEAQDLGAWQRGE